MILICRISIPYSQIFQVKKETISLNLHISVVLLEYFFVISQLQYTYTEAERISYLKKGFSHLLFLNKDKIVQNIRIKG